MRNTKVRRLIVAQCVVIGAFVAAHAINAFVEDSLVTMASDDVGYSAQSVPAGRGVAATEGPIQLAERIQTSGLFLLPDVLISHSGTSGGKTPGRAMSSALDVATKVRLLGTVVRDGGDGVVVIEEIKTKQQQLVHLHEMVPDVGVIHAIQRDGVVIRLGEQEAMLRPAVLQSDQGQLSTKPAQPALPPVATLSKRILDRREVKEAVGNPAKLLSQAHAVPVLANGDLQGFRLEYLAPGSFFQKAGFLYGDVLQRINGVEIHDPARLLSMFGQVADERTVKVDLVRAGQKTTFTYELR